MRTRTGKGAIALLTAALLAGAAAPPPEILEAARRGDLEAVRTLLRNGADPNAAQGDGLTALHVAAVGAGDLGRAATRRGGQLAGSGRPSEFRGRVSE